MTGGAGTRPGRAAPEPAAPRRPRVLTIVGTRPEVVKLSRVIAELDLHTEHTLVHSGQNYDAELNEVFFEQLQIRKPDVFLNAVGRTVAETIGLIIARADEVMGRVEPDALLLYGDTNTCLSVIPAKRRKIPVFHMEAGNRCFDDRVPEEINRRLVDHLSDVNLPLSEHARRNLLAEGIRPDSIVKTGSPIAEVLAHHWAAFESSTVLAKHGLTPQQYFLVSAHREENVDDPARLTALVGALRTLAHAYGLRVIISTHPRTRLRLDAAFSGDKLRDDLLRFEKPFGYLDWVRLQQNARCVLSDSGTLTEESSLLGFPAVMLRDAHERPEGADEGTAIMAGLDTDRILHAVEVVLAQSAEVTNQRTGDTYKPRPVADYRPVDVSKKVVRTILSNIDYVNRTVWHRQTPHLAFGDPR